MDSLAASLLEKLLVSSEKHSVGRRARSAALTTRDLKPYSDSRNLREREAFEATMSAAADAGAVELGREKGWGEERAITRVSLRDLDSLADFIGRPTQRSVTQRACEVLEEWFEEFPILERVVERWESLYKVRGMGPDRVLDWADAAKTVVYMRRNLSVVMDDLPIREVSAKLFLASKRIEQLTVALDVLLSGDFEAEPRAAPDVWAEIGLRREDQPVRLAGAVTVQRERVTALLDVPYSAMAAATVLGIVGSPEFVLTIENLTTFHSESKRRCNDNVLLIYTGGMPTPAWRSMFARILSQLSQNVSVFHWGDVDEGGFRIAANIARVASDAGHRLRHFRMSPSDIPEDRRRPATERQSERMRNFALAAGWADLAQTLEHSRFTAEQEVLDG